MSSQRPLAAQTSSQCRPIAPCCDAFNSPSLTPSLYLLVCLRFLLAPNSGAVDVGKPNTSELASGLGERRRRGRSGVRIASYWIGRGEVGGGSRGDGCGLRYTIIISLSFFFAQKCLYCRLFALECPYYSPVVAGVLYTREYFIRVL